MSGCGNSSCAADALRERQSGTLRMVLAINAVMFLVIVIGALYASSSALLADSFDNLGDAVTYGLSLYAVSQGTATKAKVSLFKGVLIFVAACVVAVQIVYKLLVPETPVFELMGIFSLAGLVWLTGSGWPDSLVATGLVILLLRSSFRVIASARYELATV
jgi:Co/Zn/Cd efflux system component